MGIGLVIGIVVVIAIAFFVVYPMVDPEGFQQMFPEPPPDVNFYNGPILSNTDVKKGMSTILTVTARNNEGQNTVSNVVAKLSVIDGSNPEEHLQYKEITNLSEKITPGDVSDTKNISIRAIKVSGEYTKFRMMVEILVDGVRTDKHEFDVKIIPN